MDSEEIDHAKQVLFAALVAASLDMIRGAPHRISCRRNDSVDVCESSSQSLFSHGVLEESKC